MTKLTWESTAIIASSGGSRAAPPAPCGCPRRARERMRTRIQATDGRWHRSRRGVRGALTATKGSNPLTPSQRGTCIPCTDAFAACVPAAKRAHWWHRRQGGTLLRPCRKLLAWTDQHRAGLRKPPPQHGASSVKAEHGVFPRLFDVLQYKLLCNSTYQRYL
jgi:hypothetical protein